MKKLLSIFFLMTIIFSSSVFAKEWSLPGITIIKRAQRGADESIRFTKSTYAARKAAQKAKSEAELKELAESNYDKYLEKQQENAIAASRNQYLLTNYKDEQKLDTSIYDFGINHLSRPESYHYAKNKIIVHHTAGDTSGFTGALSAIAYMKEVYAYHTSKWGDIGYNFLIDPYGNIYEGTSGGESVIGAHVSRNNTPSLGISLMGNFEIQKPTEAQIKSLTALITALAKKYGIDPLAKTDYHIATTEEPYIKSKTNYRVAGHKDGGITSCPGDNLYAQLPAIRNAVWANLQNGLLVKSVSVDAQNISNQNASSLTNTRSSNPNILKNRNADLAKSLTAIKDAYSKKNGVVSAKTKTNKITSQISFDVAKKVMEGSIKVLLYDLSTNYTKWDISCDNQCIFSIGKKTYTGSNGTIEKKRTSFILTIDGYTYTSSKIAVKDSDAGLVVVNNYSRVSYAKIPWNTFYGSLSFGVDVVKNLKTSKFIKQTAIVNTLLFSKYLRGIAETHDSESPEKIKLMQLISKGYALFYLGGKNKHPSIPASATYNAIDDPNSFQKYVGAGLEKTLTKVYTHFETTKNQMVTYKGYLPILPYFSCSAGFTRSGKEKRGWTDTPYLVSRLDPVSCSNFEGHGVGLSGKGAQQLALQGRTAEEILKYYYPGIEISTIQ